MLPLPSTPGRQNGPVVRVGAAFFVIGLLFLIATVVPFFFGEHNRALWLNLGCLLAPLGFAMIVVAAVRAGRADQRAALDAWRDSHRELHRSEPAPGRGVHLGRKFRRGQQLGRQ
ncbi:MAG: hypothetical protein JWN95_2772 [Frankiales bacterium]|nr:hypothetical protein [Frankiales bacterium]